MQSLLPKEEAKFQSKRVMHLAKEFIKHAQCRNCGEKERKAVDLHEFGDPFLPSQVNIYCPKCNRSEVFALRPTDEAMAFAKMDRTGEKTEVVNKPVNTAEEMLEYAKLYNAAQLASKKEEQKTIKDEAGEIIANPDKVAEIDKKLSKKK